MNSTVTVDSDIRLRFGCRVREIRLKQATSQEELAARCGLDRTYISGIERGKRNVGLLNVGKIAAALGVPVADLFSGSDSVRN